MNNIAIITARGGSKRIPRKNVKLFCGQPIIYYSIKAALESNLFSEVMVSTDDDEIAKISTELGAKVPFIRSLENSNDFATTADVVKEVLDVYSSIGKEFDNVCCIYPTAPFLDDKTLIKSYDFFISEKYDSIFPIVEYLVPIQIALKINHLNYLEMISPEYMSVRSQDMEKRYFDAGQFYWSKVTAFLEDTNLFTKKTGAFIIDELNYQDIDNVQDWEIAEFKFKFKNR